MSTLQPPTYPVPAYLNFSPGGLSFKDGDQEWYDLSSFSGDQHQQVTSPRGRKKNPEFIVAKARLADDRLRGYSLLYCKDPSVPHFLPSLSVLAEAAFGRLTGVPAASVKTWADAMVLHYLDQSPEVMPQTEQDIYDKKSPAAPPTQETAASCLKRLLREAEAANTGSGGAGKPRPCGYVFKRGDIAWNCRTCQTDPTCVICDTCFHNSNHDGHEVYFHRTTPGGCCDCGDAEAWKIEGCCPLHRPTGGQQSNELEDDPEEAVKMALKGQKEGLDTLQEPPTSLPPKLAAALGVVIGAAVNCLVQAVDGAGIGADPSQWKMRWSDEATKILNTVSNNEDYYLRRTAVTPKDVIDGAQDMPRGYRLDLRLHNDDVHTFDEVIEALHEPRSRRSTSENPAPLVAHRDNANDMTHHVDSDGQVTVKSYGTISNAMQGYRQLKSKGLHCAVVGSAQVECEQRARSLTAWLTEIASAHPAAATLIVHSLVQVAEDQDISGIAVWHRPHMIPSWSSMVAGEDESTTSRRRFFAFPPHMASSYMSREEAETLHRLGLEMNPEQFVQMTGTDPSFYSGVPYRLPSERYRKSPHSLWGTLPSLYNDNTEAASRHQILYRMATGQFDETAASMTNKLSEQIFVIDTDLRKQQESELMLTSIYPHRIPGLHMISGVGTMKLSELSSNPPAAPSPMKYRNLLATSAFRAPVSAVVLLLLLDPYPTKQVRGSLHSLFLSLLVDSRFKCRFAAALGAVAYRPLSTLFCAGVGTEADTPLGFTVQIFTAGSLIRALGNATATEKLLRSDQAVGEERGTSIGIFTMPIAHSVVRCIHTNLLGSTKEVTMILKSTPVNVNNDSDDDLQTNDQMLPSLIYQPGEHPLSVQLPAAPDDCFLDSRSTRHKRLPHLLRDLEYVMETPGTAFRLLLPARYPINPEAGPAASSSSPLLENAQTFATTYSRLLRIAQGMDPQKRKISGGHVEYEQNRWLEAFGLSLNFAGTRDALSESLTNSCSAHLAPFSADGEHLVSTQGAIGNLFTSLIKELKMWLYREGMLETGLPLAHGAMDHSQVEALQRSTLHIKSSQLGEVSDMVDGLSGTSNKDSVALQCATGIKMTEAQLELIESALKLEDVQRQHRTGIEQESQRSGPAMGDWLRTPHSPLGGDTLSFHLPLHRSIAKTVRCMCYVVVPQAVRDSNPHAWWKLPILDDDYGASGDLSKQHPLVSVLRPTLRSANCKVVWASGPDCTSAEAQKRRSRAKNVSANIASAKIIHSLADHPLRCLAAAQQIERHLWARNGGSTGGMALNYSSSPLCRSFRDLDITLVQLSAAGLSVGLGARRVFSLLISRFNMDGYLCDPEKRVQGSASSPTGGSYSSGQGIWVNPPRLQDPDHAIALSESFFTTMCILVTELAPPPPLLPSDDSALRKSLRRELLHALAAEPRSHSEAMEAATSASSRRDESAGISGGGSGGGALGDVFTEVLREVGKQRNQMAARAASGPSAYELKAECCHEYDPSFYHLRRQDHQHAMDTIARLRKQKASKMKDCLPENVCFPIVCPPPKSHPRFLACRLLLHLDAMDAAIRRFLLFAMTGGSWLPPSRPVTEKADSQNLEGNATALGAGPVAGGEGGAVPVTTYTRRSFVRTSSSASRRSIDGSAEEKPFSKEVVATSSVSCLEIVQLLTLQVHTLEECAALHRSQPHLDVEGKVLSASLSINSYLARMIRVPESLRDVWAFRPYPDGPLPSKGSGQNRASILGLLIVIYEHRTKHGSEDTSSSEAAGEDGHGGARTLAESGMKWLLRFIDSLVSGAASVSVAVRSASTGVPIQSGGLSETPPWIIDDDISSTVKGMLRDVSDLWPEEDKRKDSEESDKMSAKNREARKAAQQRVMEMMRRKQNAFAATIAPAEGSEGKMEVDDDNEEDLCIICRCDDTDGENNGPLGYLGHVQRSRYSQMRYAKEAHSADPLYKTYRVVGHRGCQLRKTEAMDSEALVCLPTGSIVTVKSSTVSEKYDVLSRRVFVKHVEKNPASGEDKTTDGWASVQSSEGYIILSPLSNFCYSNTRWGSTRPVIRQCGHAAHLKCVETHTLSLHQRAAGDQPYDGRFAANIDDGEFLCPLCKQLSNILIPRDGCARDTPKQNREEKASADKPERSGWDSVRRTLAVPVPTDSDKYSQIGGEALKRFGESLLQAMTVPWERSAASRSRGRRQQRWNHLIQRWDYEDDTFSADEEQTVKNMMTLVRQQHIAWSSLGHSAASSEACSRGVEEVTPFGTLSGTSDPWTDFNTDSIDTHPMMLELRRTMTATSGLFEVLMKKIDESVGIERATKPLPGVLGVCLWNILMGKSWFWSVANGEAERKEQLVQWSQLTALMSSMPCHVSRDGMLSQRHEARATAAAMWVLKGLGTDDPDYGLRGDLSDVEHLPPTPVSIRQIQNSATGPVPQLEKGWGSMTPALRSDSDSIIPFRPAVASSFLYTPLLAWDLNTLAGALFSTALANTNDALPSSSDLLRISSALLVGRMIQSMVTPCGFILSAIDEDEDVLLDFWSEADIQKEGEAIAKITRFCKDVVSRKSLKAQPTELVVDDGVDFAKYHGAVGRSILPFARSLILLLRACWSAVKQRKKRDKSNTGKVLAGDKALDSLLVHDELLTFEDGFLLLREMGGPLPSRLVDQASQPKDENLWWGLIEKWLAGVIGLELHHGSRGKSIIHDIDPDATFAQISLSKTQDSDGKPRAMDTEQEKAESIGMNDADDAMSDDDHMAMDDEEGIGSVNMLDDMDMDNSEEEMVDFTEQAMGNAGGATVRNQAGADVYDDSSDDGSYGSSPLSSPQRQLDKEFACVARSPIIPYQPSLLGTEPIGPGTRGVPFEVELASSVMRDMSHLGMIHRKDVPTKCLIRLPKSFVELYSLVNKVKGRDGSTIDDNDDGGSTETAICLLTGSVMRSGSPRRTYSRTARPPGACTLHARQMGSGIGIFFLVQKCTVLLMHNNKSAYSASLYVDQHGEEDPGLRRGRPLFLNEARLKALETLWRQAGVPREVAQIRSTSDRVIRDNWY